MLKVAVEKLAPGSGEGAAQLQVYTLSKTAPSNLVDGLQKLVPEADVSIDIEGTTLTVVAAAADHQLIQDSLDKIEAAAGEQEQSYFDVYTVRGVSSTTSSGRIYSAYAFMGQLQPFAPNAKMSIDYESGDLLVLASPSEHEAVKAAVGRINTGTEDAKPELQIYTLKKRPPRSLIDGLELLAPRAEITLDEDDKHLTVVAGPADHEAIKAAVDKITAADSEDGESYFELYPISGIPASSDRTAGRSYSSSRYYAARSFTDQIQPFAPDAEITVDYESGNLLVLATAKEHKAIQSVVEKISAGGRKAPELQIYTLKTDIPETLLDGLEQLVPRAKINVDEDARQFSVVAAAEDHEVIKETLDKIETAAGEKEKPYFKVYAITAIDTDANYSSSRYYAARNMMDQLDELVPSANISIDYSCYDQGPRIRCRIFCLRF